MLKELVKHSRSYRRYHQDKPVSLEVLKELVDLARFTPCGANNQALKFILSTDQLLNKQINDCIIWAAYFKGWISPPEGERPSSYIIALQDSELPAAALQDYGITAQTMLLGAAEKGLGGCYIGNIDKPKLKKLLDLQLRFEIAFVLPIGKPKETVEIETIENGSVKYWRDECGVHHVPKRSIEELILRTEGI